MSTRVGRAADPEVRFVDVDVPRYMGPLRDRTNFRGALNVVSVEISILSSKHESVLVLTPEILVRAAFLDDVRSEVVLLNRLGLV